MKKLFTLLLFIAFCTSIYAQENDNELYLLFEFMQVNDENDSEYWEVEQLWAEIHKQRIADNNIIGWDLWKLSPGGTEQGSQYMTATLYSSLSGMLEGIPNDKFNEYVEKAFPTMSDEELDKLFEKTTHSRDMANILYCKEVNTVGSSGQMKIGTVMKMDIMQQLDESYEKMEDQIFKPWHQEIVAKGEKDNWGLVRVLLPTGSTAKASHFTYSMYADYKQMANEMENWGGDMDLKTSLAVQEGLKTRDWKAVKIAQLVMMVR